MSAGTAFALGAVFGVLLAVVVLALAIRYAGKITAEDHRDTRWGPR